ncbi:MAG: hypothetical protein AAF411_28485 [Myxococcota bacterium]
MDASLNWRERVFRWFARRRRQLAFLAIVTGLVLIGREIGDAYPREAELRYELNEDADFLEVRFLQGGELARSARFAPTRGASFVDPRIDHTVSLSPGAYEVSFEWRVDGEGRQDRRTLRMPVEGRVYFRLGGERREPDARR